MAEKKKTNKDGGSGVDLLDKEKAKNKVKPPKKYKVVYHNDDYTPMDLVVFSLMHFFRRDAQAAYQIMIHVHEKGKGIAGTYNFELAEQKKAETVNVSRNNGHPLSVVVEKID